MVRVLFFAFRRILSLSSLSSSESNVSRKPPLLYFNDNPELPVYSHTSIGYTLSELVDILMSESLPEEKVCKVQPLGVNHNCTFIIDLDSVSTEDMKADDLRSWKSNGTRRSYFNLNRRNTAEFLKEALSQTAGHFVIIRRYFVHHTYSKFRRCIVEIRGK